MAFHVTPDLEAKLDELAQRTHRDKSELLEEAVNNLVAYNQWFERKVNASQEAADQGDVVADEDVRGWLERRERS
jgi:predicted transcriptional regulator